MVSPTMQAEEPESTSVTVKLPAPTPWPIVIAFGVTLIFAGLLTSASVSILGAFLFLAGCAGWFRNILPQEKEETFEVTEEAPAVLVSSRAVERLPVAPQLPRPLLPLETYPITAGIKGGLAGSAAMAVLACLYGILKQGSIWYPINLLAATAYAPFPGLGTGWLKEFHLGSLILALGLHLFTSLLVGLLYGAMLPMFPRRPIFLGGVVAPVLWTGLLHSILGLLNPLLNGRIDWWWFIASQFGFGIVAGLVVVTQERIRTRQLEPFLTRAGVEAAGFNEENPPRSDSQ